MKDVGFRIDENGFDQLQQLFAFYGIQGENFSEQMRLFINELHEKLLLYRKSQSAQSPPSEQSPPTEELTCDIRVQEKETYFCVNHPPKMVKLETLQICRVCKALFHGLGQKNLATTETPVAEPVKVGETEQAKPEPQQPQKVDPKKDATPYCNKVGMRVYWRRCETCKEPCEKAPDANTYLSLQERDRRARDSQPSQT